MIDELSESCPEFRRFCTVCKGPISDGCGCEEMKIDVLADIAEHWKRNREKGVRPRSILGAIVLLAKEISRIPVGDHEMINGKCTKCWNPIIDGKCSKCGTPISPLSLCQHSLEITVETLGEMIEAAGHMPGFSSVMLEKAKAVYTHIKEQ